MESYQVNVKCLTYFCQHALQHKEEIYLNLYMRVYKHAICIKIFLVLLITSRFVLEVVQWVPSIIERSGQAINNYVHFNFCACNDSTKWKSWENNYLYTTKSRIQKAAGIQFEIGE